MANPKWFDADVYMQNKLVQMQASDPAYTMPDLVDAFAKAGYVGPEGYYAHFVQYGADEDVAPNAFFNAQEYYTAKAAQYYGEAFTGSELQVAEVKALIQAADMNAWTHYQQYGSAEGVDPSNAFDASAYCAAKALAMNDAGLKDAAGKDWTADSVKTAIDQANMSVLEHYLTYAGTGVGEVAAGATYPVADDDHVVVPNPGKTVVVDGTATTFNGTAGDDTFYVDTKLQEYNTLDGREGNDTLILNNQAQAGTIKNIENLVVRNGNGNTYDLSAFSSSFTLEEAGATVTVDNVTGQKLAVSSNAAASTLNVNMAAGQTSVDLTSQNRTGTQTFALTGDSLSSVKLAVDEGAEGVSFTGSGAKVTNLAITATASDAKDDAARVDVAGLEKLTNITVAGAGAVDLAGAAKDALATVNATANTGGVSVDLSQSAKVAFTGGAGNDKLKIGASTVAHDLGAGDDTLNYTAALDAGGSVAGGEGTDTVSLESAKLNDLKADFANNKISGFEALTVTTSLDNGINMADYAGINHLTLNAGIGSGQRVENMQSGSTLELTGTANNSFDVTVDGAAAGKADVLNIALTGAATVDGKAITVADVENINIMATDTDGNPDTLVTHKLELKANNATTVTVGGDAKLNLTLTNSDKVTNINASENTGGLSVDVKALHGVTVTGSSAADEITMGIGSTVTGGKGNDTFIATKVDTPNPLSTNSYSTITDFEAGDTLKIGGMSAINAKATAVTPEMGFDDMVKAALADSTNGKAAWFEFGGSTYVVLDNDNAQGPEALANDDYIVKLAGVTGAEFVANGENLSLA